MYLIAKCEHYSIYNYCTSANFVCFKHGKHTLALLLHFVYLPLILLKFRIARVEKFPNSASLGQGARAGARRGGGV